MTQLALIPTAPAPASRRIGGASPGWLYGFLGVQVACQLLLLSPVFSPIRVILRSTAFAASAALLALLPLRPSAPLWPSPWAKASLAILALNLFHPGWNTPLAAFAQVGLYLSILGPLFWVPRLAIGQDALRRFVVLLWLFNTVSSVVGVLQVYFPGSFQPALSSVLLERGPVYLSGLEIEVASGERVFRPMGLTSRPGGASVAGLYAMLLGLGVVQTRPFLFARTLGAAGMVAGAMCIYLSHIRSVAVMTGICLVTIAGVLAVGSRKSRFLFAVALLGFAIPASFYMAESVGGEGMVQRLSTLSEGDMSEVYYRNRGHFLEATLDELLPAYPFGAGLGRHGMMNHYFGVREGRIWVEIQWTAWLLDGGVPLIIAYAGALLAAIFACYRLAIDRDQRAPSLLSTWAAVIVGYDVGVLALCFNVPLFMGTTGVEFWALNAVLLQAAANERSRELRPLVSQ